MDRPAKQRLAGRILLIAIVPWQLLSQPPPAFDVASVKLVASPLSTGGGPWTASHGRFKADSAWVRAVIAVAYGIPAVQVHGGPAWVDSDRYDFDARAESPDSGLDQIRPMLQTLLADRFKLVAHRETRETGRYTLVPAKGGSKLQEAKEGQKTYINWTGKGHVTFTKCNMAGLVNVLSFTLSSPVLDQTGLSGLYNFKLDFSDPRSQKPGSSNDPPDSADIFTAVQEQLGLKLEAGKGPAEVLVIDHMERASGN